MRLAIVLVALLSTSATAQTADTTCYRMGGVVRCTTTQQPAQRLDNYIDAMGGTQNLASPFTAMEAGIQAGQNERRRANELAAQEQALEAQRQAVEAQREAQCRAPVDQAVAAGDLELARSIIRRCG